MNVRGKELGIPKRRYLDVVSKDMYEVGAWQYKVFVLTVRTIRCGNSCWKEPKEVVKSTTHAILAFHYVRLVEDVIFHALRYPKIT